MGFISKNVYLYLDVFYSQTKTNKQKKHKKTSKKVKLSSLLQHNINYTKYFALSQKFYNQSY